MTEYEYDVNFYSVSLFTREWIEIYVYKTSPSNIDRLPLYEGVD